METITRNEDGTATITTTVAQFITFEQAAGLLGLTRSVFIRNFIATGLISRASETAGVRVRTHDVLDLQEARLARQRQSFEELRELQDSI